MPNVRYTKVQELLTNHAETWMKLAKHFNHDGFKRLMTELRVTNLTKATQVTEIPTCEIATFPIVTSIFVPSFFVESITIKFDLRPLNTFFQ